MSAAEVGAVPRTRSVSTRFLRSELRLIFRRRRNLAGLVVLAAVPVLIAVAVRLSSPGRDSGGPDFFGSITENGLFVALASLTHRDRAVPSAGRGRHLRRLGRRRGQHRHAALPVDRARAARPAARREVRRDRGVRPGRHPDGQRHGHGDGAGALRGRGPDPALGQPDRLRRRSAPGAAGHGLPGGVLRVARGGRTVRVVPDRAADRRHDRGRPLQHGQLHPRQHPAGELAAPVPDHPPLAGVRRPVPRSPSRGAA